MDEFWAFSRQNSICIIIILRLLWKQIHFSHDHVFPQVVLIIFSVKPCVKQLSATFKCRWKCFFILEIAERRTLKVIHDFTFKCRYWDLNVCKNNDIYLCLNIIECNLKTYVINVCGWIWLVQKLDLPCRLYMCSISLEYFIQQYRVKRQDDNLK